MKKSTDPDYSYIGAFVPVEVVVFKFYNMSDYILSKEQYESEGKYKGIVKSHSLCIRDIECLESGLMNPKKFKDLPAWEG